MALHGELLQELVPFAARDAAQELPPHHGGLDASDVAPELECRTRFMDPLERPTLRQALVTPSARMGHRGGGAIGHLGSAARGGFGPPAAAAVPG